MPHRGDMAKVLVNGKSAKVDCSFSSHSHYVFEGPCKMMKEWKG
jgi:hypothetical protein